MDERQLIQRVVDGDEGAFRTLYRAHASGLYRFALLLAGGDGSTAEEVVQETWVRAVRGLGRFEGRSRFRRWLHGIAARCASEERRRERPVELVRDDHRTTRPNPGARLDLERAVAALPGGFRAVLILHDVEGYTHTEIAEILGIAEGTSKSQLSRARARVRALLGDEYVEA